VRRDTEACTPRCGPSPWWKESSRPTTSPEKSAGRSPLGQRSFGTHSEGGSRFVERMDDSRGQSSLQQAMFRLSRAASEAHFIAKFPPSLLPIAALRFLSPRRPRAKREDAGAFTHRGLNGYEL